MIREALVVDDDSSTRTALADLVRRAGFNVAVAESLAAARAAISSSPPDVVLCDLLLPDGQGTELLGDADNRPSFDVIVITGNATVESAVEALRLGAYDYLTKPIDLPRLKSLLEGVRRTRRLRREVTALRGRLREIGRFGRLVGTSEAMQRVYSLIEKVAPTEATVLVSGESGTGKELVAWSIHELSARAGGPFVPINCGAISPTLMESEIFGHEKGAFTGAAARKTGFFEAASGGTLFLDEVTEMPPELQVRFLRAVEAQEFTRVGGTDPVRVSTRIVAATNRDPARAVQEGALREDLYYRLRGFPIELPPLRARGNDLDQIARVVIDELNASQSAAKRISDESLVVLARHHWPGNVRELRNVLQQAFILADDVIEVSHLPAEIRAGAPRLRGPILELPIGSSISDAEMQLIDATLESVKGDKTRAAEILGISLKTLYNKLKQRKE